MIAVNTTVCSDGLRAPNHLWCVGWDVKPYSLVMSNNGRPGHSQTELASATTATTRKDWARVKSRDGWTGVAQPDRITMRPHDKPTLRPASWQAKTDDGRLTEGRGGRCCAAMVTEKSTWQFQNHFLFCFHWWLRVTKCYSLFPRSIQQ